MKLAITLRLIWCLGLAAAQAAASEIAPSTVKKNADSADCTKSAFVIAVDIGHSPSRPGAISARGIPEYRFNRRLAHDIVAALHRAGFKQAFLVNDRAEGDLQLKDRTGIAQAAGARLFLSIHHDSVQPRYLSTWTLDGKRRHYSDIFSGYSLFVSARNPDFAQSEQFGRRLGAALRQRGLTPTLHHAEPIPGENRPLLDPKLGLYRFDDLVVLHSADMPALLFEAGVIVNREEEQRLASVSQRAKLSAAVVDAIARFCAHMRAAEK